MKWIFKKLSFEKKNSNINYKKKTRNFIIGLLGLRSCFVLGFAGRFCPGSRCNDIDLVELLGIWRDVECSRKRRR